MWMSGESCSAISPKRTRDWSLIDLILVTRVTGRESKKFIVAAPLNLVLETGPVCVLRLNKIPRYGKRPKRFSKNSSIGAVQNTRELSSQALDTESLTAHSR